MKESFFFFFVILFVVGGVDVVAVFDLRELRILKSRLKPVLTS